MESFFKRYGWVVHLALIAIVASLIGWSLNKIFAIQLAPYTVPEVATFETTESKKAPTRRRGTNRNFRSTIVNRCLFGCPDEEPESACPNGCDEGQVCQAGKCVDAEPSSTPSNSEIAVESDLAIKLLGCMVAKKPDYSLALLQEANDTFIAGVGDSIGSEGAEVLEVRRDRIIINRNGRKEFIKLQNSIGGAPTARKSALTALGPAATDIKTPRIAPVDPPPAKEKGVRKVGTNKYELERSAVEGQLSDAEKLAKQARIVPNVKGGKTEGIKLIGVQGDSVYSKIGIRTGDVVHSINGKKITSQARALELLDQMRKENNVKLQVERGGKKQTFEYTIK